MKQYIAGIGEALWDLFPEGAKLGGAPANFAFHTSQFGLPAIAISSLGNDELGDKAEAEFQSKGLEYLMPRIEKPTGVVNVTLDNDGVPSYEICEGVAWDNIPFTDEIAEVAKNCQAVCWGTLSQRAQQSRETINKFIDSTPEDCIKIFDINLRQKFYSKEIIEESLCRCNILKINDEEIVEVCRLIGIEMPTQRMMALRLMERYEIDMLILTCGTEGSYIYCMDGTESFLPTPKVKVADTVGAGDSFTGAFIAALLCGKEVKKAHALAVEVSAYVCTQNGAMPELPEKIIDKL
jgi:fructokinase